MADLSTENPNVAVAAEPADESKDINIQSEAAVQANRSEKGIEEAKNTAEPAAEAPQADGTDAKAKSNAETDDAADATPAAKDKARRKSGAADMKRTLSKKNSKVRLTHTDAKPGDHFLVKLKGFPHWPAIICDEDMLPEALLNSRPVTAARPDGTYAENYADGGKRVNDRTFPVMYLFTNEFGWVANTSLTELTPEKAKETVTDKMRKDLKAAFELAAEHNSVEHYKGVLKQILEDYIAAQAAMKEAAATPKKSKKGKGKGGDDDGDVDMVDAEVAPKSAKAKKRKAGEEEEQTPQRSDSVKKPKIKLNTSSTPKTAKATSTPSGKDKSSASKPAKTSARKIVKITDKNAAATKQANMTPEERRILKEKEVMYLRHRLQRGFLTPNGPPLEKDMNDMAKYMDMLENTADIEVSIIRGTKINKVLKGILKLDSIPGEQQYHFKSRSQDLLDKWNKLMVVDTPTTNGVNGTSEKPATKRSKDETVPKVEEASKSEAAAAA